MAFWRGPITAKSGVPYVELTRVTPPVRERAPVSGLMITVPAVADSGMMVPKVRSLRTLTPIGLPIVAVAVSWAACASFPDASNNAASPMMEINFLCKLKLSPSSLFSGYKTQRESGCQA